MEEFVWVDIPPLPISDAEYDQLTVPEVTEREEILAQSLGAFAGRWVEIKNSTVLKSAATPKALIGRRPTGRVQFVPPAESGFRL
ncbi:MAG TPA: hypothetical protein VFH37_03475 [Candidatus Saccharimonadales bacterium]|nr:hypothetical protein [Candidatus Saccharimonadales bacterium]